MSLDDMNKLNRLEELKGQLFRKNYRTKIEHRDDFSSLRRKDVVDSWQTNKKDENNSAEKFFMKTSIFKKFFIFSIVFFLLALGYGAYVFFVGSNTVSNGNIDIAIQGNNFTAGGDDLPLIVEITNRNTLPLELVDLVMQYPKGSSNDLSSDMETFRESLGTIPAGGVRDENLKAVLFGEQGSTRTIKISIEYRLSGSNAIFVKDKTYDVTITSTPVNLSVDVPSTVSSDQNMTLDIKTSLNSTEPVSNILVRVDYPIGFQFTSSVPSPSFGNNIWSLGDLAPGAERDISVSGKMVGVFDGEQKTFTVSTGSQSSTDKSLIDVVFNSIQNTVAIQKPFVEANLSVNGVYQREYAIDSSTAIHARIDYVNNLDTKVDDLQIQAKLSGNAFNRKTIIVERGFYDSSQNIITWDKGSDSDLTELNPGDSGSVQFSLSPLSLFSASGGILSDPTINIEVDISGKQSIQGFATNDLSNSTSAIIRLISDVGLSAKALYYSGSFANTGPIPPKADQTTTYTISWSLSNTSNSISNIQVTSSLPPWTNFVGSALPASEDLSYNSSTKTITWNVGSIGRGAGITGSTRSVSFQISLKPSVSQVGSIPDIINDAILTGHDDFANVDVKVTKNALNTRLDSDPTFPAAGSVVSN